MMAYSTALVTSWSQEAYHVSHPGTMMQNAGFIKSVLLPVT